MDNTDLITASDQFRTACKTINEYLKVELDTFLLWKEKEREIRLKYFKEVTSKRMSQALFNFYLKDEIFDEDVAYKKAKTERIISQNQKDSLQEKLNTIKKQINIL